MARVHFIDIYSCRKMQKKLLVFGGREFSEGGRLNLHKDLRS